jgi:xanthine/uracil permease
MLTVLIIILVVLLGERRRIRLQPSRVIGIIVLVIGVILAVLGTMGRAVGGRRHYH